YDPVAVLISRVREERPRPYAGSGAANAMLESGSAEIATELATEKPRRLGILAGGGPLPAQVAAAAQAAGRGVFIVGLEGFADPAVLAGWPHEIIRMGAAGRILATLRAHGCQDLVLIGPVRRPSLLDMRPDAEG